MILRTVIEWKNGSRWEDAINTDASRGRYLLASHRAADGAYWPLREVKNGYQFDTPKHYTGNAGGCTTTVTLERGWV